MSQPVEDTARANDAGALVEYVRGVTHIFGVLLEIGRASCRERV